MNILVYASVFHPGVGGIEHLTRFLIEEFIRTGHAVKVITPQPQDAEQPLSGVEVVGPAHARHQWALLRWSDVLFMPNLSLKGVWLPMLGRRKHWVISHNDFHLRATCWWLAGLKRFFIGRADRHIAVSRPVAEFVGHRAQVVHCCFDDRVFRIYGDEARRLDFLFVGRLVTQKGCDLLIEACSRLQQPFTLTIVGDGPEAADLRSRVAARGLDAQVRFLGMRRGEELARIMNQHRTMVIPSIHDEGFGVVALEGLACGCHMVAARAGGLVDAIGMHGDLFDMGDIDALHGLLQAALDRPFTDQMTPARIAHVRAHWRESIAREYLRVFAPDSTP